MFGDGMFETERIMRREQLNDHLRVAEVDRLLREARAAERLARPELQRSAWVAAGLQSAATLLRHRFVSPCGQFTPLQAKADC
jgi:hypothetical protein